MSERVTQSEQAARTAASEFGELSVQASGVERRVATSAPESRPATIITTTSPEGEPIQTATYASLIGTGNRVGLKVTSAHPDAAGTPSAEYDRTKVELRVGSRKATLPTVVGRLAAGTVQRASARRVSKGRQ